MLIGQVVSRGSLRLSVVLVLTLFVGCQTNTTEPVALAPEDLCAYCRMAISEKRYAAQLLDSEGRAYKFDDIGCMGNFVNRNERDLRATAYFVMDFDERIWIKAEEAYYVRSSELTTPMNGGIVAFQTQAKAQQAAEKYHGTVQRFNEVLE